MEERNKKPINERMIFLTGGPNTDCDNCPNYKREENEK